MFALRALFVFTITIDVICEAWYIFNWLFLQARSYGLLDKYRIRMGSTHLIQCVLYYSSSLPVATESTSNVQYVSM